jgi:hypothetical protein
MGQLKKFSDRPISSEATWQQAERSETRQSNLTETKCPRARDQFLELDDVVRTVAKVTEVRIKSLTITKTREFHFNGRGVWTRWYWLRSCSWPLRDGP